MSTQEDLNLLHERWKAIARIGLLHAINGTNTKEELEARHKRLRELDVHIIRIQQELGCAPNIISRSSSERDN